MEPALVYRLDLNLLGIFWGRRFFGLGPSPGLPSEDNVAAKATSAQMVEALLRASEILAADFGDWRTPGVRSIVSNG